MNRPVSLIALSLAAISGLGVSLGGISSARAQSLESEVAGLVQSHPAIAAASSNVQSADQGINAAWSGFLPDFRVSANAGPEHYNNAQLVQSFGAPITRPGEGATETLTQHVFDGGLTSSTIHSAQDTKAVQQSNLRITRQNTILEGINAYIDILRQSKLLALARDNEANVENQLGLEQKRAQGGSGQATDVLGAQRRVQVAKEKVLAYQSAMNAAQVHYLQVFGHPAQPNAEAVPIPPADAVPPALADAVTVAQSENPSVEAAKRTVTLTSERENAANAGYYPSIDLVAKADQGDNRDGNEGYARDWELLVELNWDLFSGFKTKAQAAQASYDYAASQSSANQAARKAAEAARLAYVQISTTRQRVAMLNDELDLSKQVLDARVKSQAAGKATLLDVLDAQTDISSSQGTLISGQFDLLQAQYQMIYALGRLEPGNLDAKPNATGPAALPK